MKSTIAKATKKIIIFQDQETTLSIIIVAELLPHILFNAFLLLVFSSLK
jgi:hypothetical protein